MQDKILLYLLIGLSIAFILERKPINIIFNFVGILITLAFLINRYIPEAQYFSFILIIIYTSALSILFGFIIMLNPNYFIKDFTFIQQLLVSILSFLLLLFFLSYIFNIPIRLENSPINNYIHELFSSKGEYSSNIYFNYKTNTNIFWQLEQSLVEKIGFNLYSTPSAIIKFFIATLILLLALISLFYLLII